MRNAGKKNALWIVVFLIAAVIGGCAGHPHQHQEDDKVLAPPAHADPAAAQAVMKGNQLYAQGLWIGAKQQYETAIQIQPTLAEAHYNLALILHQDGRFLDAKPHFVKAANLAPGNKIMWNAPPFRKYGTVEPAAPEPAPDGHMGHSH